MWSTNFLFYFIFLKIYNFSQYLNVILTVDRAFTREYGKILAIELPDIYISP